MFSGLTVMIAMLGMTVAPVDITISLGLGAILVVMSTLVAALVLLPAVLSLLDHRIDSLRIPGLARLHRRSEARGRFWEKLARSIMRRPLPYLLTAAILLIACATPTLLMKTGNLQAGAGTYPDRLYPKQGWNALDRQFSLGKAAPVQIVVDGQAGSKAVKDGVERLQASLVADGRFSPSQISANKAGDLILLTTGLTGDPAGDAAQAVVKHIRTDLVPVAFAGTHAKVYVTGTTGFVVDYLSFFNVWLPVAIVLVLALSFILMLLAFRSIVIAAKTIILNLLSVGAAYGLMVLVFQKGVGAHLLGFNQVDRIEAWVPLVLFSMLFGLLMDYQVFLLSRIKERYDQTGDTREAVAHGIGRTAGIITGAAAIMVVVFAGVASGEAGHVPADGIRPRGRHLPRRHHRADYPGTGGHGAARRLELVPASLARVAATGRDRRRRQRLHAEAAGNARAATGRAGSGGRAGRRVCPSRRPCPGTLDKTQPTPPRLTRAPAGFPPPAGAPRVFGVMAARFTECDLRVRAAGSRAQSW